MFNYSTPLLRSTSIAGANPQCFIFVKSPNQTIDAAIRTCTSIVADDVDFSCTTGQLPSNYTLQILEMDGVIQPTDILLINWTHSLALTQSSSGVAASSSASISFITIWDKNATVHGSFSQHTSVGDNQSTISIAFNSGVPTTGFICQCNISDSKPTTTPASSSANILVPIVFTQPPISQSIFNLFMTTTTTTTTTTPAPTTTSSIDNCTISSVDPSTAVSSIGSSNRGVVADCRSLCLQDVQLPCRAYIWAGANTMCTLYGTIDQTIEQLPGSVYQLVDVACQQNLQSPPVHTCGFINTITNVTVAAILNASSTNANKASSEQQCALICNLHSIGASKCTAFAFSSSISITTGNNCYVLSSMSNQTTITGGGGAFNLYMNTC